MTARLPRPRHTARTVLALVLAASSPFAADRATPAAAMPAAVAATSSHTLLALACPTVSQRYAGGDTGAMLGTKDGGKTWQPLPLPTMDLVTFSPMPLVHQVVTGLTCPSAATCFAPIEADCDSGEVPPLLRTANGGTIWREAPLPESCGPWTVVCPGLTTCYGLAAPDTPLTGGALLEARSTIRVTGRLRLDVVAPCSTFSARIDGVRRSSIPPPPAASAPPPSAATARAGRPAGHLLPSCSLSACYH